MKCKICGDDVLKNKFKEHLQDDYNYALDKRILAGRTMDEVLKVAKKLKIRLDI